MSSAPRWAENSRGPPTVIPAAKAPRISAAVAASIVVPAIIADAGGRAARRFLDLSAATIRNRNIRAAYHGGMKKVSLDR